MIDMKKYHNSRINNNIKIKTISEHCEKILQEQKEALFSKFLSGYLEKEKTTLISFINQPSSIRLSVMETLQKKVDKQMINYQKYQDLL